MVQADMIDTWLFAALIVGVLALGVILRGVPAKSRDDRLVAGTVTVIHVSIASLLLSIALGMVIIIDVVIVLAICTFGVLFWSAKHTGAEQT